MRLQLFVLCFFTAAPFLITSEIIPKNKDISVNLPNKENVVEGSGLPPDTQSTPKSHVMAQDIDWEASGVGPDDEDGDVDDGSAVEGSGREPAVINVAITSTSVPIATTRQSHVIDEPIEHHVHEISKEEEERSKSNEGIDETTTSSTTSRETPTTITTKRPPIFGTQPPRISYDDEDPTAFTNMLKPGILAAITGGTVVGILMAILLVMFIVYRMRKKDEGSYSLDEPGSQHPPQYSYAYQKASTKEFYA
uniref:Syndecan n=1 Tax=Acrobeloides nanus TaxID=290746 RepID=A0A914EMG6_9BILA